MQRVILIIVRALRGIQQVCVLGESNGYIWACAKADLWRFVLSWGYRDECTQWYVCECTTEQCACVRLLRAERVARSVLIAFTIKYVRTHALHTKSNSGAGRHTKYPFHKCRDCACTSKAQFVCAYTYQATL